MVSSCAEYCTQPNSAFYNCQLSCLDDGDFDADCLESCNDIYGACLNSCNSSSFSDSFNVVQSVNGATVSLNDTVLAQEVGEPMFFWYGQLLNVAITFVPVVVVVSCFWLIYGYLKNLGNKNSLDSKKSLENK